ncbi:aldose 1-epimerase [soil metagenome]
MQKNYMAFSIKESIEDGSVVLILKDEITGCKAVIYSFGALLNAFEIPYTGGLINIIDGYHSPADAKQNVVRGFKSAKLSPFVCRMKNGEYIFNGAKHKIDKFYLGDAAIHGLLFNESFIAKEKKATETEAAVTLSYTYYKVNEGFPFAYNATVTYTLAANNKLTLTTIVSNIGNSDMPLSDGWHPYFTLGVSIDELLVQFRSKRMLVFDDGLMPTGEYVDYNSFNEMKKFGNTVLDNCFELGGTNVAICNIKNETNGLLLSITPSKAYPYLQVYTPPHRKSIALENLSSAPDAFNNKIGLIILEPGEQKVFSTVYGVSVAK